ncbi:MAG TPA: hypothetical protein PL033_04615 [Candidatus Brocadiia bacterium]|nr:hypothetical protein [Candidatus Brocadiia bacterium]
MGTSVSLLIAARVLGHTHVTFGDAFMVCFGSGLICAAILAISDFIGHPIVGGLGCLVLEIGITKEYFGLSLWDTLVLWTVQVLVGVVLGIGGIILFQAL